MKHRDYRRHQSMHQRHSRCKKNSAGFIKRTIKGLAKRLSVSKRIIIIGFVALFIFTKIFALLAFFLAYLWIKSPGRYEDLLDRTMEKSRSLFNNLHRNSIYHSATAGGANSSYAEPANEGFDFSDLKRKFDDLERRAENMEEHVSSEEYKLRKEFEDI